MSEALTLNPILATAKRGGVLESAYRGAIAVRDAEGRVVASIGDVLRPIFPRSAVKALQAIPFVESGAAERFELDDEELAVICASHSGEPRHVAVVEGLLGKIGLDAGALECGTHWPYREPVQRGMAAAGVVPTPLHNNCSGKHAGFLGLAACLCGGVDLRQYAQGYVAPRHPVMRAVTAALQATTGYDLEQATRGIDGCSIPTYAIPLHHLAQAFARFGTGTQPRGPEFAGAAGKLRAAVAREPFMVGGTGRFDTKVMEHFGERVFCKVGAEGVFCAALPERGLGIALKMDDGNSKAAEAVLAATLQALLGDADAAGAELLGGLAEQRLRNWNGIEVGMVEASGQLRRAFADVAA